MRRLGSLVPAFAACLALVTAASAAGPGQVAIMNRSAWPLEFKSRDEFDQASRLALLAYARILLASDTVSMASWKQSFGIKSFDSAAFQRWKRGTLERLRANFNLASRQGAGGAANFGRDIDAAGFRSAALTFEGSLPDRWKPALPPLRDFLSAYFREQGRLAALFPKVSSEITAFDSAEIQGYEYRDMHFLLTFDDGPTPKGGTTDSLLMALRKRQLTGIFFVLGERFNPRLKATGQEEVRSLYRGMSVQVHGMTHVSHARLTDWKEQVLAVRGKIDSVIPPPAGAGFFFRPPYGQRVEKAAGLLADARGAIMLWNIDSQDWNARIGGEAAAQRCFALMLLWRRGILLFHDVHGKAQVAVPLLHDWLKDAGVVWVDANDNKGLSLAR